MKKEFVNYNQALALKELGFDEDCLMYIDDEEDLINDDTAEWIGAIKAPLKQQAILFLLNKCDDLHGAELSIEYFGDESGILKNYGGNFTSVSQAIDKLIMLANDKMP